MQLVLPLFHVQEQARHQIMQRTLKDRMSVENATDGEGKKERERKIKREHGVSRSLFSPSETLPDILHARIVQPRHGMVTALIIIFTTFPSIRDLSPSRLAGLQLASIQPRDTVYKGVLLSIRTRPATDSTRWKSEIPAVTSGSTPFIQQNIR